VSFGGFDASILQDFLTESGELLEQLESDLVTLEHAPDDPEMLNQVFRALHTIKGSASFLGLTNLVSIAHAAESALNAARNRVIVVNRAMMDLLLQSIDVLKVQFDQVRSGSDLFAAPASLVKELTALGDGKQAGGSLAAASGPVQAAAASAPALKIGITQRADAPAAAVKQDGASERVLELGPGKQDLVEYLVADLDDSLRRVDAEIGRLGDLKTRTAAIATLISMGDELRKAVDFFGCVGMTRLTSALGLAAAAVESAPADAVPQILSRLAGVCVILRDQVKALSGNVVREWPIDTLLNRLEALSSGRALDTGVLPVGASGEAALVMDGVRGGPSDDGVSDSPTRPGPSEGADRSSESASVLSADAGSARKADDGDAGAKKQSTSTPAQATTVDQTIRVEVGRLETLMNLVGELVLQKNRIAALSRRLGAAGTMEVASKEAMTLAASGLDRVTADIQVAVMRTRMQPLEKLLGKYPRLIRDLCGKTGKKIDLVIEGGDTEVDKSIIEELGDPLIHLLRNSADHGVEMPADRVAAGKPETGTITLRASHEGSHVQILIMDDGRGFQREKILKKAIERGLVKADDAAGLSDKEVYRFIMLPGFSTAEVVSDLSGRGVGMDVVRTNIESLDGSIELSCRPGKGSTVAITIPLTVAILPAMMVAVAHEIYAIPLGNILEIVKPLADQISTVGGHRVMRLRDAVLPLIGASDLFGLRSDEPVETPFVVVLSQNDKRVGLLVTRPIGQQEIVIKPLDGLSAVGGTVSGATVRDDGGVSLIVDVGQLLRIAEGRPIAA